MSKKKKIGPMPKWALPAAVVTIAVMAWLVFMQSSAYGANVDWRKTFSGIGLDSVRYRHDVDGLQDDSNIIHGDSLPYTKVWSFDNGVVNHLRLDYFWYGTADTADYISVTIDPIVATPGVATIIVNDMQKIAGFVKDTADKYPAIFYGPTATGPGDLACTLLAAIGAPPTTPVYDVKISVVDAGSNIIAGYPTDANGKVIFYLFADTSYIFTAVKPGYTWEDTSYTIAAAGTYTISGVKYNIVPPTASNVTTCWGLVYKGTSGVSNLKMFAKPLSDVNNVCDSVITFTDEPQWTDTDDSGYFQFDLTHSSCLRTADSDSTMWKIYWGEGSKFIHIWVPSDSATYQIPWSWENY